MHPTAAAVSQLYAVAFPTSLGTAAGVCKGFNRYIRASGATVRLL